MSIRKLFVCLMIVSFITSLGVSLVSFGKIDNTVTVEVPFSEQRTSNEKIDVVLSAKDFERNNDEFIHSVVLFNSKYKVTIEDVEILKVLVIQEVLLTQEQLLQLLLM